MLTKFLNFHLENFCKNIFNRISFKKHSIITTGIRQPLTNNKLRKVFRINFRCASYKPRFGEEHCFFLGKKIKRYLSLRVLYYRDFQSHKQPHDSDTQVRNCQPNDNYHNFLSLAIFSAYAEGHYAMCRYTKCLILLFVCSTIKG